MLNLSKYRTRIVKEGVIGSGVLTNEEAYWEESKYE